MSKELIKSFTALEEQKGIKQEEIVDAIKAALIAAYKKIIIRHKMLRLSLMRTKVSL